MILIQNILQRNVVQILADHLVQSFPDRKGNTILAAFALVWRIFQAGDGGETAFGNT